MYFSQLYNSLMKTTASSQNVKYFFLYAFLLACLLACLLVGFLEILFLIVDVFVVLPTGSTHEVMLFHSQEFVGVSVASVPYRIVEAHENCSFVSSFYGVPATFICKAHLILMHLR